MANQGNEVDSDRELDAALDRFERAHESFQAARAEVHEAFIQLSTAEQAYGAALEVLAGEMAQVASALLQMGSRGGS